MEGDLEQPVVLFVVRFVAITYFSCAIVSFCGTDGELGTSTDQTIE